MPSISHIVNILEIKEVHRKSYLHIAQPLTLASMKAAKAATKNVDVELFCIKHKDENIAIPSGFSQAKDLQRYCYDAITSMPRTRDLPILADIINSLYESSDSDYYIYSNVDIGVSHSFYEEVLKRIHAGYDAFTIDRRDLPKHVEGVELNRDSLDLVYKQRGIKHGGHDCFVFRREIVPHLNLGNVFIGYPPVGRHLMDAIEKHSEKFKRFRNRKYIWPKRPLAFHLGSDRAFRNKNDPYYLENLRQASKRL